VARSQHDARVRAEFARQADSFASSRTLGSQDLTDPIRAALGPAARGRILDLAAGPGIVSSALASEAREVVALDLTPETLRLARQRCRAGDHRNVQRVCGDALATPFRDAAFDGVVLRLALHHLESPERTLGRGELRRLLEQTGFELCEDRSFTVARSFAEWAAIISDPVRMESLEVVMRELAQRGVDAGIGLREQNGAVHFDYDFGLLAGRRVADAPAAGV
jgi:ubiquinone/menaquinone biosynthesis C-methylase UbiE